MVHALRKIVLACFVSGAALAAGLTAGCETDNTTTGITPITGIVIRSDSLIAGRGCGMADAQVLKYVAVVSHDSTPDVVAAGIYDCFADGVFSSLDTTTGGSFELRVYAFNAAAWAQVGDYVKCAVAGGGVTCGAPKSTHALDGGALVSTLVPPLLSARLAADAAAADGGDAASDAATESGADAGAALDAGADAADASSPLADAGADATGGADASDGAAPPIVVPTGGVDAQLAPIATWKTTCLADQQADVEVLAVCDPLK